jgi:hypothetical protein
MTLSFISVPSSWPSSLYPSSAFSDMTSQSPRVSSSSSATFNPNMGDTAATQQQQVSPLPQSSTAAAVTLHPLSQQGITGKKNGLERNHILNHLRVDYMVRF